MSKLLVFDGKIAEDTFCNINEYLPANSLLLYNDTRVINARLVFEKATGARIEVFCLDPISPCDYSQSLSALSSCSWKCLVGNSKKWKEGYLTKNLLIDGQQVELRILRKCELGNAYEVQFEWTGSNICFSQIIEAAGNIPIPPYLNRQSEAVDKDRYQTVYSHYQGSVAAPTAGLHFTENVLANLKNKHIDCQAVTLHVGAGTFQPVKTDLVAQHEMHTEHFIVTRQIVEKILHNLGNITITGTTTVRTVESLFCVGVQVLKQKGVCTNEFFVSQWEAYDISTELNTHEVFANLLAWMQKNNFNEIKCATQIMIIPGFKFRVTNRLITNFHQPKSTLLLLLSAFIGDVWKDVYDYALAHEFRFLSYGDSCLFFSQQS